MNLVYVLIGAAVIAAVIAAVNVLKRKREEHMPQGIQIFDANGALTFDLANNTTCVLGTGQTGAANGSISDARVTARTWVVVLSCPTDGAIPYFSVAQGTVSWQFLGGQLSPSAKNVTFMYGAY